MEMGKKDEIQKSGFYIRKLKMSRLVDRWSLGTLVVIAFTKLFQLLKKFSFKVDKNGWRKVTGIFLRNEYSKFILTSFRLKYYRKSSPDDIITAKMMVTQRLGEFIRKRRELHWALTLGFFEISRKRITHIDIIEAQYNNDQLVKLTPLFDTENPLIELPNSELIEKALAEYIAIFNDNRQLDNKKRPLMIRKKMVKWARVQNLNSAINSEQITCLVERLLCGAFIHFETITGSREELTKNRVLTPCFKDRKHIGQGLLNIICRFTPDLKELDLWMQFHHVPVDGAPMQEMLRSLKNEWGSLGPVTYPSLKESAKPELFYAGEGVFRARIFARFDKFLKLRKYLNNNYSSEMGGSATVASMMIWGITQHDYFCNNKFVFPVDTDIADTPNQDRDISLVFIRPTQFQGETPLAGFIKYQREFNQRIFATRMGKSESYELLDIYAMVHPFLYKAVRKLLPKAIKEIIGESGLTLLRDSEIFITPLTELQSKGFVAVGNILMPTEDGGKAGAVSMCGSEIEVTKYIEAINNLLESFEDYLNIDYKNLE